MRCSALAVATIVAAAGCAGSADRAPTPSVAVETTSSDYVLGGARSSTRIDYPVGVLPLPEERLAAIDDTSFDLEVFGPDGHVLFRDGGKGEGPGEFRDVSSFFPIGVDSLGIWDAQLKRVSIFSKTLSLLASKTVYTWPTVGVLKIIGRFSSGAFVGLSTRTQAVAGSGGRFFRDKVTVVVGQLASSPQPLVSLEGARRLREQSGQMNTFIALPDENPRAIAVCGDSIVVLGASTINFYAGSGGPNAMSIETYDYISPSTVADAAGRAAILASLVSNVTDADSRKRVMASLSNAAASPLRLSRRPLIAAKDEIWFLSGRDPISLEQLDGRGGARQRIAWNTPSIPLRIDHDRLIGMTIDSLGTPTIRVFKRANAVATRPESKSARCGPTFIY